MKLLITGGAGFIGSHLVRALLRRNPSDDIINLDQLTYAGSRDRLSDVDSSPRYKFAKGNICDAQSLREVMRGVDIVVHLAAETHVDRSITDAAPFLRTNVEGTNLLLQSALDSGIKKFVHVSTDEVYGPIIEGAADESAPLSPRSPYAASKAAGDLLVQAYNATYDLPTVIVRPTNIFGTAQLPEKFIPLCITNGLEGKFIPIYGDGMQRRNWLFTEDLCTAILTVIEKGVVGSIYNIGSGTESANYETALEILNVLGGNKSLLKQVEDRPGHDRRYAMLDEKIRELGWKPAHQFKDSLRETINWYQEHSDWWKPLVENLSKDSYHWLDRASTLKV